MNLFYAMCNTNGELSKFQVIGPKWEIWELQEGPQTHKSNHKQTPLIFPCTYLFFSRLRSTQRFLLGGNLDKVQHLWFIHIVPFFKMFHLCSRVLLWLLCPNPSLHSKYQDKFSHKTRHCNFVSLAVGYTIFKK